MKNHKLRKAIRLLVLSVMLLFVGCAGKPVSIELPADHPANPQAPDSQFTPPQNIFKTDLAAEKGEPEADSISPS